jgi:hypothetical protein
MNNGRVLYHLVKADFLQRVRTYSFLLALAGALYIAYTVVAEKMQLRVGDGYRGIYNSAWLGALMTVTCAAFLTLVGFYIVKNALRRDVETRVGQILATTPMRKSFYTVAKMLSNLSVLAAMVMVLMAVALAMQFLRAEDVHINLWQLWSPFVLIAVPAMAITAACAILFETIPVLRGGVGNVIYFFVWSFALAMGAANMDDFAGLHIFYGSMKSALRKVDPTVGSGGFNFTIGSEHAYRSFVWTGVDWTPKMLIGRLLWLLAAVAIALLASVFFHRFDPAFEWKRGSKALVTELIPVHGTGDSTHPSAQEARERMGHRMDFSSTHIHLSSVKAGPYFSQLGHLVLSEFRLLLKGHAWWWYVVASGLFIATLVSQPANAGPALAIAWLWPVLIWSQMGTREGRHATASLLFSSPRSLYSQLPSLWTAGVLVALATGSGAGLRLLLSHDFHALLAWLSGALFIPSLALALGVWSGSSKAFEAIYTVWWYAGPLHQTPGIDFMGTSVQSQQPGLFLLGAGVLLGAAYVGRRVRMAYV